MESPESMPCQICLLDVGIAHSMVGCFDSSGHVDFKKVLDDHRVSQGFLSQQQQH